MDCVPCPVYCDPIRRNDRDGRGLAAAFCSFTMFHISCETVVRVETIVNYMS